MSFWKSLPFNSPSWIWLITRSSFHRGSASGWVLRQLLKYSGQLKCRAKGPSERVLTGSMMLLHQNNGLKAIAQEDRAVSRVERALRHQCVHRGLDQYCRS
ncbi:hypothetical protein ILYODFUR_031058 [Ilyodon furcidens]|uniref:Uncharacterized protein n=1 Tax=Ilyodon furcidens TaxID=33524 RepID=A0ABV0V7K9_9TELE